MSKKDVFKLWLAIALLVVSLLLILLAAWPLPHASLVVMFPTVQAVPVP
jgi:di/tricarboxylate transporter